MFGPLRKNSISKERLGEVYLVWSTSLFVCFNNLKFRFNIDMERFWASAVWKKGWHWTLMRSKCSISWEEQAAVWHTSFTEHHEYKSFIPGNKYEHEMNKHKRAMSRYICNLLNIFPNHIWICSRVKVARQRYKPLSDLLKAFPNLSWVSLNSHCVQEAAYVKVSKACWFVSVLSQL